MSDELSARAKQSAAKLHALADQRRDKGGFNAKNTDTIREGAITLDELAERLRQCAKPVSEREGINA